MRILIATDGSDFSQAAIDKVGTFLRLDGSVIKIVSAYEDSFTIGVEPVFLSSQYYQEVDDQLTDFAAKNCENAAERIRKHCPDLTLDITTEVLRGYADQQIVEVAKRWKADLIVVGSHGYGFLGRLLGSVSNGVVHNAPCSVMVVRKPNNYSQNGHSAENS